nr:MAG TPA: hypothetical protein [Caudoviricetes sp.]
MSAGQSSDKSTDTSADSPIDKQKFCLIDKKKQRL